MDPRLLTEDGWKAFVASIENSKARKLARELNHQYDAGLISLERFLEGVKSCTGRDYDIINSARSSENASTSMSSPLYANVSPA